ncbi:MAG: hypothetical protein GC179_15760 [Anaerolineaceae bacterium]|nr:hypothetical protein [Anaerolineaceae bacterium]
MSVTAPTPSPSRNMLSPVFLVGAATLLLLFAAWLRMQHIVSFYEWPDEIWSLWHVQGTFSQAMSRVPYDWPPLFSIVAWVWTQIVGPTLEASRVLMVQFALLSLVFMYRAARLLYLRIAPNAAGKGRAAWVAMVATVSMSYLIFSSVEVRAYGVALMLGALALWLTLRWMHKPSSWWRTGLIALVLALEFYSTYTSLLYIGFLSLMVILVRPRLTGRWTIVGLFTVFFALPTLPQFISNALGRLDTMLQPPEAFPQEMVKIYSLFGGTEFHAVVMGIALLIVLYYAFLKRIDWRFAGLLVIWVGIPAVVYVVKPNREFLSVRYMWWVALGLVVLIGAATIYLPRLLQWGAIGLLLTMTFLPIDWLQFRSVETEAVPIRMVLSWFAQHLRPGDVVIKDPYCVCGTSMVWDYFMPQFFPQGDLPWATQPGTHSRVWYLATTGWQQDEKLKADILNGRKESIFVGPWNFLLRLYEGPPLWQGVAFGDQVAINGFEIPQNRSTFHENETIQVKLWWSALKPPSMDYSISLAVFDEYGNLVTQSDGPAHAEGTPEQISQWQPGQYYEDFRTITLPVGTPGRDHYLVAAVYDWQTGKHLIPAANTIFPPTGVNGDYVLLEKFSVIAY